MKKLLKLLPIIFIGIFSLAWGQDTTPHTLTIYSSQGTIEIKGKEACHQAKNSDGSISISCNNQCTQSIDKTDGKVLIKC